MMRRLSFLASVVAGLVFSGGSSICSAENMGAIPEYSMKSAYIYNFSLLTSWPSQGGANFNVCVFGQDEFGSALDMLQGKLVDRQQMQVVHINGPDEAKQCRVVFFGDVEPRRAARLMAAINGYAVLTVTDDKRLQNEAMIYLEAENQRLVFAVNAEITKRANLTLSSKLLRLAKRVVMQ